MVLRCCFPRSSTNNNKHRTFQPVFEENAVQRVHLQINVSLWGESRFFFNFQIWTEVIPYNALNSEIANFETACMCSSGFSKIENGFGSRTVPI
jgi:hypothetical protein